MGGYGSGRHGLGAWPKDTVEGCLVLSAATMQRKRRIEAGLCGGGSLAWKSDSIDEEASSISYHVNTLAGQSPTIRLQYTTKHDGEDEGEWLDCPVGLTTTPLPWGGVRWWFICPLVTNGRACGRRVGKLYLPPGGRRFGCRRCYDLTYQSTRDAHSFDFLDKQMGWPLGASRWVLRHDD